MESGKVRNGSNTALTPGEQIAQGLAWAYVLSHGLALVGLAISLLIHP